MIDFDYNKMTFAGPAMTCSSAAISTMPARIIEDIERAVWLIEGTMPKKPPEYQLEWAHANGFPGWPSFKLGVVAYGEFRQMCIMKRQEYMASVGIESFDHLSFNGIPIVCDPKIHPRAVIDVRTYWQYTHPGSIV